MSEFLRGAFADGPPISPVDVLVRLLVALAFGIVIAALYQFTRKEQSGRTSFGMTLLLLCVLIAMVTQVIGDNVARAFSLVGALSIVRFRTVVRDTEDTAYVILSVVAGMAVGARSLWVAAIGIFTVALAELLLKLLRRIGALDPPHSFLKIRVNLDVDLDAAIGGVLSGCASRYQLLSISTLKQGGGVEAYFRLLPRSGVSVAQIIRFLTEVGGVQGVLLTRPGFEAD